MIVGGFDEIELTTSSIHSVGIMFLGALSVIVAVKFYIALRRHEEVTPNHNG